MLAADAEQFCGKRYQRHADRQGYRWGLIGSEVGWQGGKAAIRRPRVRERGGCRSGTSELEGDPERGLAVALNAAPHRYVTDLEGGSRNAVFPERVRTA
jgi:hypothetical protein